MAMNFKFDIKQHWWIIVLAAIAIFFILKGQGFMGALFEGWQLPTCESSGGTLTDGVCICPMGMSVDEWGCYSPSIISQVYLGQYGTYERLPFFGSFFEKINYNSDFLLLVGFYNQITEEKNANIQVFGDNCDSSDADVITYAQSLLPDYDYSVHTACGIRYLYVKAKTVSELPSEGWVWCTEDKKIVAATSKDLTQEYISYANYAPIQGPAIDGKGDLDNDGYVSPVDISLLQQMLLGATDVMCRDYNSLITFTPEECLVRADLNDNGVVDSSDLVIMKQIMIGGLVPSMEPCSEDIYNFVPEEPAPVTSGGGGGGGGSDYNYCPTGEQYDQILHGCVSSGEDSAAAITTSEEELVKTSWLWLLILILLILVYHYRNDIEKYLKKQGVL